MTPIQSCFAFLILFCKLYLFFVDLLLKILEEWKEKSSNEDRQKEKRLLLHICPFHWLYMCVNPLNPKRDQNLISPYSNTAESFIKIMRIKEMITHRYEALITKRILLMGTIGYTYIYRAVWRTYILMLGCKDLTESCHVLLGLCKVFIKWAIQGFCGIRTRDFEITSYYSFPLNQRNHQVMYNRTRVDRWRFNFPLNWKIYFSQ